MTAPSSANGPSERLDQVRRVSLAVVAALAVALTAGASAQILQAVFAPPGAGPWGEPGPGACRTGVRALLAGVDRARGHAAARGEGEREALAAFRRALEPEWSHAADIAASCRRGRDVAALTAFRQVELLRYAEERAVRYEALDLSLLRRRAPALVGSLAPP